MTKLLRLGALLLCLLLLASCSAKPRVVTAVQVVDRPVPVHLLAPTPVPSGAWCQDNADLLEYALDLREALAGCNADKEGALKALSGDDHAGAR